MTKADTSVRAIQERIGPAVLEIVGRLTELDTPKDYANALKEVEDLLLGVIGQDSRILFAAEGHLLAEVGILLERMLTADYDDAAENWRWSSGLGYQLIIPAGWEQLEASDVPDQMPADFESMGFTLDKAFGRDLSAPGASTKSVSFLMVGHRQGGLSREELDAQTEGAEAEAKKTGFQVQRVYQTGLNAVLSYGRQGKILRCDALVASPTQTLFFKLALPPDRSDLLGHCRSIAENVAFDG
jgi:hypothetical protein